MGYPLAAGLLLVACAEDPDISGIFRTTSHLVDDDSCGTGEPAADPAYFRLRMENFFVDFYALASCDGPSPDTCDGGSLLSLFGATFVEPGDDGWTGESFAASSVGVGTPCLLAHVTSAATWQSDGTMQVEISVYSTEDATLIGEACKFAAAEARQDELPCTAHELLVGEKVAEAPAQ